MAKKEKSLEESKKKKVPFNVLRKGAIAGLLGLTIGFGCLGLAGCSNGTDGKDGTQWYSGTATPTTQGVNGDYYYDTDDYLLYQKTNGEWKVLIRDFGKKGDDAVAPTVSINGDGYWVINGVATDVKAKGEDGNDGSTPTITIVDGYWAINGTKTSTKAEAIDGMPGKDGNIWTVGTTYPSTPNTGDMFLNNSTWNVYQYNGTTWEEKGNIKGGTGATGGNGQAGQDGKDGTNIYVGYDGYVWQDGERTTFKLDQDTTGRENVVEDTIGAYTTMGYWQGEYVDLSTNSIALMANYKPNAKLTQYSGTKVTEIQVVAESAGTLHIGTAKVADVVTARTNGTTYTATTTSRDVTAGVNTITLDLTVAEDETIVIGGSNSTAKVYVVKNLPVADEQGNFALVNGQANTDVISKTGDYADTLAVRVKATATTGKEVSVSLTPALKDSYTSTQMANNTIVNIASTTNTPYIMKNNSQLANKTITKIGVIVKENNATSGERPYLTVYKVKNNFVPSETNTLIQNVIGEPIKLYFPANTTTNAWAYAECEIELGADETLAWGGQGGGDTLAWGYAKDRADGFYNNKGTDISTSALIFDIYVQDFELNTFEEHLNELAKKEQECVLAGYL